MGSGQHKRPLSVIAIAAAILAGFYYLNASVAPAVPLQNSEQSSSPGEPLVAWSPSSTQVILAGGQTTSQEFTFTSNVDLQNVSIEAVPEIAPFLTIQPASFPTVASGQSEAVAITFSVPTGNALGIYSGTLHLRSGNQTLPQTLKVSVIVGTSYTNSALHLQFVIPPIGATPQAQVSQRSDGATQVEISGLNPNDQQLVPEFELTLYPNAAFASLHDWFEQNVDVGGVLLSSNSFTLQQLTNGSALVRTGPIPTQYEGGPMDDAYALSPSGDAIMSVSQSQVNDMGSQGYSQQQITVISLEMLGTVQSF